MEKNRTRLVTGASGHLRRWVVELLLDAQTGQAIDLRDDNLTITKKQIEFLRQQVRETGDPEAQKRLAVAYRNYEFLRVEELAPGDADGQPDVTRRSVARAPFSPTRERETV